MKDKNTKNEILQYINDLIWYTQAVARDQGFEVPTLRLSRRQMEVCLNYKYWLLWDIKNFIEEEIKDDGRENIIEKHEDG